MLATLGQHRSEGVGGVAGLEALIAEELRAARHFPDLAGPDPENLLIGSWSRIFRARRPAPEAGP